MIPSLIEWDWVGLLRNKQGGSSVRVKQNWESDWAEMNETAPKTPKSNGLIL